MFRENGSVRWPALALLPWAVLQLWPDLALRVPGGPAHLGPSIAGLLAVLLAAGGAASLLARLELSGWWIAALVPGLTLARVGMGVFGVGHSMVRSLLTVVLLGAAAHASVRVVAPHLVGAVDGPDPDPASTGEGTGRRAVLWGRSKRAAAALMACPYLLLAPFLVLHFGLGWNDDLLAFALTLVIGSLFILGLPALGILYALRPFRFGFLLVSVLSLAPVVYGGTVWYAWDRDPQVLRDAGMVAGRLEAEAIHPDSMYYVLPSDERVRRHAGRALLDRAEGASDDAAKERIATGLMALGEGRKAESYLWDLMQETEGDPERARLHGIAREAYGAVWARRPVWAMLLADRDRMPVVDDR